MKKEIRIDLNGKQVEVTLENIRNLSENLVLSGRYVESGDALTEEDLDEAQSLVDEFA